METFEEQFPSFKKEPIKFYCMDTGINGAHIDAAKAEDVEMWLRKHCLDKQRVKDAIEKLSWSEKHQCYNAIDPVDLLKELELKC